MSTATILYVDNLSLLISSLIGFIGACTASFSRRYLKGDRKQKPFYLKLFLLIGSMGLLVCANHLILFLACWMVSNITLTKLMLHKKEWLSAKNSAHLAFQNFMLGSSILAISFLILFLSTGELYIQQIIHSSNNHWITLATSLLIIVVMTQCALWPFERWLLSSLNSPTPVSAIMHAGLINGGGVLVARFSPLFAEQEKLLTALFLVGILSALLGTLWKLMQSDIKRMLACSTMGQMGFMIAQCGLGLFAAAIAHLCWHGMFKAYLFLSSGGAAKEKRLDKAEAPTVNQLLFAIFSGTLGAYFFCLLSGSPLLAANTNVFLTTLALVTGTQVSLPLLQSNFKQKHLIPFALTSLLGAFYGLNVLAIEAILAPLQLSAPQPLNLIQGVALTLMVLTWLSFLFYHREQEKSEPSKWRLKAYVLLLNASQPHPSTVTTYKNHYKF